MRRRAASVGMVLALAVASAGPAAEAAAQGPTVDTFAVSFVIASPDAVTPGTTAVCPNLPAGTTLTGSGTEKSITTRRTDARGIETIANVSHADGIATDQAGNRYVFNYSNELRVSNTPAEPDVYSGTTIDAFSVAGHGPANLHNGFVADITANAALTSISFPTVRQVRGDPIDFVTNASHCDPI